MLAGSMVNLVTASAKIRREVWNSGFAICGANLSVEVNIDVFGLVPCDKRDHGPKGVHWSAGQL